MCTLSLFSYILDDLVDQLGVNLTLLLTITAYKELVADTQANVNTQTLLDEYLSTSTTYMVVVCFEQAIVPNSMSIFGLDIGEFVSNEMEVNILYLI